MTNFSSLPRELRDQIYGLVLVSPVPIPFSNILGPSVFDPDLQGPMAMLFSWASNQQIADEACEIFYRYNTFLVYCEDLPILLGAMTHRMLSLDVRRIMSGQEPACVRPFQTKKWVTNMIVVIEQGNTAYSRYLAYELEHLFECPRLRSLTIKTGWHTVLSWEKEWKDVLKDLRFKMGEEGFEVIYSDWQLDIALSRPVRDVGALFSEPVWREGDVDGDGDVEDHGNRVRTGGGK